MFSVKSLAGGSRARLVGVKESGKSSQYRQEKLKLRLARRVLPPFSLESLSFSVPTKPARLPPQSSPSPTLLPLLPLPANQTLPARQPTPPQMINDLPSPLPDPLDLLDQSRIDLRLMLRSEEGMTKNDPLKRRECDGS